MEKTLEKILDAIEEIQVGQGKLRVSMDDLKVDVKEIRRKTDVISDQTAGLNEFTTATTGSLTR